MSESPSLVDKVEEFKINDDDVVDPVSILSVSSADMIYTIFYFFDSGM